MAGSSSRAPPAGASRLTYKSWIVELGSRLCQHSAPEAERQAFATGAVTECTNRVRIAGYATVSDGASPT
jgi:hypothetical protein